MSGATLFQWLEEADFYRGLHEQAVAAVPPTGGRWLDVGCGPGLVARQAALRGFEATGFDASPQMIAAARSRPTTARFEVASLGELAARGATAAVVSAASLVVVLRDARAGLTQLWSLVAPGGCLLLIETTARLNVLSALRHARGRRDAGLVLWGLARSGRSVAPALDEFRPPQLHRLDRHALCGGLVGAWLYTRSVTPKESS